ncbi:MAG: hypothetical protein KGZ88_11760 [Methylomicrobium sp.]|nr:hypothetical protein [Methylomicrobium sp.]
MSYTPGTAFVFDGAPYTPQTAFNFNLNPIGTISGTLPLFTGYLLGVNDGAAGVIGGTLPLFTGVILGDFDPNVTRLTVNRLFAPAEDTQKRFTKTAISRNQGLQSLSPVHASRDPATPASHQNAVPVDQTLLTYHAQSSLIDEGKPLIDAWCSPVEQLPQLHIKKCGTVDNTQWLSYIALAAFDWVVFTRTESQHSIEDSSRTIHDFIRIAYDDPAPPYNYTPGTSFVFNAETYTPETAFIWPYTVPEVYLLENQQLGGIRHINKSLFQYATPLHKRQCATVQDAMRPLPGKSLISIDPPRDPPPVNPDHITYTIPDQANYIMQHEITVTLLDLTPVPMSSVSLSLDADAYTWQFRGQLADKAALSLVQQPPNGDPVQLIVNVNGAQWYVIVERIEHSRQFASHSITLSGRGLSALLGQPYEQPSSATQASELTVQQIAELQLPLGWSLNWQCPTWIVANGAFTFSGQTPIQVLSSIARDIGAMLVPSQTGQSLTMMPRYPVLPWQFSLSAPDLIIPEAAIIALTQRPVVPYQANGVYVHGGEIGGVIGWCRLNSTDGARLAQTVSNSLITDVVAARALGERILAGHYTQPAIQSITLPFDGDEFPLAQVGWLIQATIDSAQVRGIINAVSIDATLGTVRQTLQIGEETPNTWALFKELLPRDPLLVGTLSSTDGTTSLITLLDGGVVRVRGTGTTGNKYYIRAGRIEGEAPNLTQSEIVI